MHRERFATSACAPLACAAAADIVGQGWSFGEADLDLLADLNEPQRQAVTHTSGPLLVLAGAGSGKTRVITRRVAHLISQGVPPWNVLAITFTNKAAGEMKSRIEAMGTPRGSAVGTFHSVCARLLREFAEAAGISGEYTIYDRDDQLKAVEQAIEKIDLKGGSLQPAAVHAAISKAKNELMTAQAYAEREGSFFEKKAADVYREYEKLLAANNALDFDDLLMRMAFLLRDRPDIRELLGRRFQYVLIDEYQDTNHAQYIIAHGIAMDHENICATGDPDQSIYAWRGADIRNILEFESDYPDATVIRLEENYRSTAPILTAAASLISCNRMRKRKALWTRREGGSDVRVIFCDDEHAEARIIAERIAAWRSGGRDYDQVAVFYRVNSLSRVLEEAFFAARIPYRVARGVEFFNRKEVKDLLAYLKLLVNGADDIGCLRIINTPARGIGSVTVSRLRQFAAAGGLSLLTACGQAGEEQLGKAAARVRRFAELIGSLASNLDRPVREIAEDAYRRSGMEAAFAGKEEEKRQARSNMEELITTAAEFDQSYGGTLNEYLYQVSLVSDLDHYDGQGGAVTLMTLHAAKGLEFPAVFVVGCEDGLLPFDRSDFAGRPGKKEPDALEEERRLAFVGMTRAKDELTLTSARRRRVRGQEMPRAASPFLGEIGSKSVKVEDLSTPAAERLQTARPRRRGGFYAEVAERELIEAMQEARHLPPEYEYLKVGCRVDHPKFGQGTVAEIGSQPWPETRAKVYFDRFGLKTLVLSAARLELL